MKSTAATPDEYINELPVDRKPGFIQLRQTLINNLPPGFSEVMCYGMIGYVVPHRIYPPGYHCDPKLPLAFISIASQKNFIALHHMGIYADKNLLDWFVNEYQIQSTAKLDMGKGCIRFKKPGQIPFALIGQLASKLTPHEWVTTYENVFKPKKS